LKNVVQVTILGKQYAIKSDVPPEEVEMVAAFVNEKIGEVVTATNTVDSLHAMVLAFLNLASEYLQMQEGQKRSEAEMAKLLSRMDTAG
jgi:cell division protein ZapA